MKKKNTLESVVLKRNIGKNAPDLICDLAASGTIPALEELVTNAHDADAEHVTITYDAKQNTFTIEDDGVGMDQQDLVGFYRLGDSKKIEQPLTAKGRRCIGKFGIATILLKYLAKEYDLETVKKGKRIVIHERFDGDLSAEREIPYDISDAAKTHPGTRIVLRNLNFKEGDDKFSLRDFIRRLQWDMPIHPDFAITVNGTTISSKHVENAKEYLFNEESKQMGHVHGTVYFTTRKSHDAGVHVYVNGRRVGDPKVLLRGLKYGQRIVGIIHADGIERAILFDRGRFKEDHAGYQELAKTVRKFLGKIEYEIKREQEQRRLNGARMHAQELIVYTLRLLNGSVVRNITSGRPLSIEYGEVPDGLPATYDPAKNRIVVSTRHPQFRVTDSFDASFYRAAIVDASIDALVAHAIGSNAKVAQFLQKKQEIVTSVYAQSGRTSNGTLPQTTSLPIHIPTQAAAAQEATFSDIRMYEPSEIANISGLLIGTVNRLKDSGALPFKQDKARGSDVLDFLGRIQGTTSLHTILHGMVEPNNIKILCDTATKNFMYAIEEFPFLLNVGKTEPCIFVRNDFVNDVKNTLKKRVTKKQVYQNLQSMMDRDYTLNELAQNLGTSAEEVKRTLVYVGRQGLHLPIKSNGSEPKYNYFYASLALRRMRSGETYPNVRDTPAPDPRVLSDQE